MRASLSGIVSGKIVLGIAFHAKETWTTFPSRRVFWAFFHFIATNVDNFESFQSRTVPRVLFWITRAVAFLQTAIQSSIYFKLSTGTSFTHPSNLFTKLKKIELKCCTYRSFKFRVPALHTAHPNYLLVAC